ncbi:hypothetical protein A2U01_0109556, partial [Trifolium medium]|nr:hypothetical protein [Trifolium medium]
GTEAIFASRALELLVAMARDPFALYGRLEHRVYRHQSLITVQMQGYPLLSCDPFSLILLTWTYLNQGA